ncbi:unnamed protein product [Rotaria sp. Silwood1]|nr:unnamed protein product [Rotaria sp. Silwood1]CAF1682420.1 unnamed protein product [Rotaria sp. Silwood1]
MNFGVDKDSSLIDTSVLPNDIFTRVDDDFFLLKLLSTPDVFAFFQIESEETDKIKAEFYFKSKTGQHFVKPGIQTSLSYLIKLLNQKLKEELTLNENNETRDTFISNEFIDKHPLLKSLIRWYQQNDSENNNKANRYTELIKKFAICLYIFGGKQCYEFVRLNMPGSIPHLSTLGDLINISNMTLTEAEFKFDSLQKFQSGFGFYSEDTTGIIPKVEYDSSTNSFIGFTTPIVDGIPLMKHYQADTFDDFKIIYKTNETAPLLNVHMFQSISTEDDPTNFPKPVLLSAYGVDNKFTAMDILRRWMYIFERCLDKDVRIIGFSTDPVHIVTKWRNRLLSSTADLYIGNDKISMAHIEQLIDNNSYTKLDHGLTKSDINPKDRQNYNSCIKLISDDVINLLNDSIDSNGTVVYLTLLKMIVKAYIDKSTSSHERKSIFNIRDEKSQTD